MSVGPSGDKSAVMFPVFLHEDETFFADGHLLVEQRKRCHIVWLWTLDPRQNSSGIRHVQQNDNMLVSLRLKGAIGVSKQHRHRRNEPVGRRPRQLGRVAGVGFFEWWSKSESGKTVGTIEG